ncbi:MAG TPA: hypothetical protein VHF02_01850 [Luteimonas sp.]|nr:hypothetical protein [Luteimonas sp.]
MFSAAEVVEALRKRARKSLRPELPPGEFPPGWRAWFAALAERIGKVTGASSDAIIAIFLQREPVAPPRRVGELNRWQSFAMLWRQQWQPPGREGRRTRIAAYAITFVVHLLLLVILLWLASIHLVGAPAPQGEEVVQVEYIGTGTPEDVGGGPPSGAPEPPTAAASAPARSAPATPPAPPPAPVAQTLPSQPKQPAPPQPPVPAQPLQVTEAAQPDTTFVLASPNPQVVELPRPVLEVPDLQAPTQAVKIAPPQPPVQAIQPTPPQVAITVPQLNRSAPEVILREVVPLPAVQAQVLPDLPIQAPAISLPSVREIPMPAAAATATATTPAQGNAPIAPSAKPGGTPTPRSGTQPGAIASGSGQAPAAKPGARPTPQRGDDWGASTRNRPGGNTGRQPGLFNADGSPRLPPGSSPAPGGGWPPGTIEQDIANLDRAGTWLRRPPNDYTPTRFDKFWAPNETLLAEWVRKNIREVSIPIPGTSKKLRCVVSLLQLGGGCGIDDPNMQDQEAIARPPPDIPFKPELQDDQDVLRKPPGSQ